VTYSKKKLFALFLIPLAAIPVGAFAATTTLDASAKFAAAITLTPTAMNFGTVEYTGAPTGGTDTLTLGTNGATANGGGVFSAAAGSTTRAAGIVTINTGTVGETVEVRCSAGGVIGNAGSDTINLTNVQVTDAAGTAAPGAGHACLGTGGAAATTLVLDGTDAFKFGAKIDGSTYAGGAWAGGTFSTTTHGTAISVDISYQ
jgi:hypothetical protein